MTDKIKGNTLILHHNDLDGYASAALVKYFAENAYYGQVTAYEVDHNFRPLSLYSGDNALLSNYDYVWVVDYAIGPENETDFIQLAMQFGHNLHIIDHHTKSFNWINEPTNRKMLGDARIFINDTVEACFHHVSNKETIPVSATELVYMWIATELDSHMLIDGWAEVTHPLHPFVYGLKDTTRYVPLFIEYVTFWDTWQQEWGSWTNVVAFSAYMKSKLNLSHPVWKRLIESAGSDTSLDEIVRIGKEIVAYNTSVNDTARQNQAFVAVLPPPSGLQRVGIKLPKDLEVDANKAEETWVVACVMNKLGNSDMFGEYYDKFPVVICYAKMADDKYKYTLYSHTAKYVTADTPKDDKIWEKVFNCNDFAAAFGGGGHIGAAGFKSDEDIFKFLETANASIWVPTHPKNSLMKRVVFEPLTQTPLDLEGSGDNKEEE